MCKGAEGGSSIKTLKEAFSAHTNQSTFSCELCDTEASVYCPADDAFLCRKCDKQVHGANFLAQRHIRCLLCRTCHNLTHRYLVGVSVEVLLPTLVCKKDESFCTSNVDPKDQLKRPFLLL